MAIIIAPTSNDTELRQLMNDVDIGKIQLPDLNLQYESKGVRFKYRTIEGITILTMKLIVWMPLSQSLKIKANFDRDVILDRERFKRFRKEGMETITRFRLQS